MAVDMDDTLPGTPQTRAACFLMLAGPIPWIIAGLLLGSPTCFGSALLVAVVGTAIGGGEHLRGTGALLYHNEFQCWPWEKSGGKPR